MTKPKCEQPCVNCKQGRCEFGLTGLPGDRTPDKTCPLLSALRHPDFSPSFKDFFW